MQAAKWAEYAITGVQYEPGNRQYEGSRIAFVEARMDLRARLGSPEIWTRQQVVDAILHDHETFITAFVDSNGSWSKGAHIQLVRINGMDYLRTDRQDVTGDDLGRLGS